MLSTLITIMMVLVLCLLLLRFWLRYQQQRHFPYQRRYSLITPAEQRFLHALQLAVGSHYQIFAQVRMADVLTVKPNAKLQQRAQGLINSKHFDFVLCQPHDYAIVCAIEVDDASHQWQHRQQRDLFVDTACQVANLPLLRFPVQNYYDSQQLQHAIQQAIQYQAPTIQHDTTAPRCPLCQQTMIKRVSKHGPFWGCSHYPQCKGTLNI